MAELQGSSAKAGYKKATVWGTATVIGAGDQFEYASETVTPTVQLIDSDQIVGNALGGASDTGTFTVQGDLVNMVGFYDGRERWVRDVFGDLTTTTLTSPDRKHLSDYKASNLGFFGVLAFEKVVGTPSVHETDSFKPMALKIEAKPGDFVRLTVTGIGRKTRKDNFDDAGIVNTSSATWTLPSGPLYPTAGGKNRIPIRFGHTKVYIRTAATGLEADDIILPANLQCLSALTLEVKRNSAPSPTTCDGDFSSEPVTDTTEITGTFEFPIYNDANDFLVTAYLDKKVLTGAVVFDSGIALEGAPADGNLRWEIMLPAFQLTDPGYPVVPGLGKVPVSFPFKVHFAEFSVDMDLTAGTDPINQPRSTFYNKRASIDAYNV